MTKPVISLALLLACASSLQSQIAASLVQEPGAAPSVQVRNTGKISLVAFAVALNPTRESDDQTPFVAFFDEVVDRSTPLEPDHEQTVPVLNRLRPGKNIEDLLEPPVITAGLLADGTSTGDPVLVTRLMVRRRNLLLAVETAMETLLDAGSRNVPRDRLIEQFRRMADAMWRWYVPPEQQIGRGLYLSLIEKLRKLPEPPLGSPFPPTAFVAGEASALNKWRVALLESQPGLATAPIPRAQ